MGVNLSHCCCSPAQICTCFGTDRSAIPTTLHGTLSGFGTVTLTFSGTTSCGWGGVGSDGRDYVLLYNCSTGTWTLGQHTFPFCAWSLVAPYSNTPSLSFPTAGSCGSATVTL